MNAVSQDQLSFARERIGNRRQLTQDRDQSPVNLSQYLPLERGIPMLIVEHTLSYVFGSMYRGIIIIMVGILGMRLIGLFSVGHDSGHVVAVAVAGIVVVVMRRHWGSDKVFKICQ